MKEVNWTNEENIKISRMYPYLSNADLAKIFKRSIASVQHRANRMALHKDPEVAALINGKSREGEKCCNWKGGKKINKKGHILILKKGHPMADAQGYILEHRYVMSEYLGRPLRENEIVHHINGNKTDNRIENLKIMTNAEHTILHHTGKKRNMATRKRISEARRKRANQ